MGLPLAGKSPCSGYHPLYCLRTPRRTRAPSASNCIAMDGHSRFVGIAPTKTLATVANRFAKKDATTEGVLVLATEAEQEAALARMELTDLWGVAGRLAARMRALV